jgi:hypothetical protein
MAETNRLPTIAVLRRELPAQVSRVAAWSCVISADIHLSSDEALRALELTQNPDKRSCQ